MNTSAVVFEALSDIDSKFSKFADKEYDNISAEIKKWFKKLAVSECSPPIPHSLKKLREFPFQKEEKAHDDRIASANAKIKQAGIYYGFMSRL
jgi:hypothetical protein